MVPFLEFLDKSKTKNENKRSFQNLNKFIRHAHSMTIDHLIIGDAQYMHYENLDLTPIG